MGKKYLSKFSSYLLFPFQVERERRFVGSHEKEVDENIHEQKFNSE